MNLSNYLVFDFETDGVNPLVCQPLQIAGVVLDPRSLKPYDGATFQSYIQPNFDTLDLTALEKNKITIEQLREAPPLKVVWKQFAGFCKRYDVVVEKKKKKPIPVGYNIRGYDLRIVERLNTSLKVPQFFSIFSVDVLDIAYTWYENDPKVDSISLDSLRNLFGLSTKNAHNAIEDVKQTAEIFKHFIQMNRKLSPYIRWN